MKPTTIDLNDEELEVVRRALALVQLDALFNAQSKRTARELRDRLRAES